MEIVVSVVVVGREDLVDELADDEHEQWRYWINWIINNHGEELPSELVEKWEENDVDYSELSEELKEKDRKWARKAVETIENSDNAELVFND